MRRKALTVILALLMTVGGVSLASAFDSVLTSTMTSQVLQLNCLVNPSDGLNSYDYILANPALNTTIIEGFALKFPGVVADDFAVTQTPTGWVSAVVPVSNEVLWRWDLVDPTDRLFPGGSFQFSFTSALPPAVPETGLASAQNGYGFSGTACGPVSVVPEPSAILLGLMGIGGILGARRFRMK